MSKNDGGAAFPSPGVILDESNVNQRQQGAYEGMTLRQYLAAHSPLTIADANDEFYKINSRNAGMQEVIVKLASMSVRYADALLLELSK